MKKYILSSLLFFFAISISAQYNQTSALTCFASPVGTSFNVTFNNALAPASDGTLTFYYQGDIDNATEFIEIFDEDTVLVGVTVPSLVFANQCKSTLDSITFIIPIADLQQWAADQIIEFSVDPQTTISTTLCTPCSGGQLKLEYLSVSGANDAAVMSVDSPAVFCSGSQNVKANIANFGINQLDSVEVNWEVNGVAQPTFIFRGLLDTLNGTGTNDTVLNIGTATFIAGSNTVIVYTSNPNGVADTVNFNDTINTTLSTATLPTNFTTLNPGLTSVQVSANGFSNSLDFQYGLSGFLLGTGTIVNTTTVPFTINGLNQGAIYDVYVRSNCSGGDTSSWVGPITFNTSYGVPFTQDFEGFNQGITGNPWPEGWSSTTTVDPNWESENAGTPSNPTGPIVDHTLGTALGVYVYMETSGGTTGDSADFVSPPIFIDSSMTVVELKYWYFNFGANVDRMDVLIDTNGVEEVIASFVGQQQTAQSNDWLEQTHLLTGYQGKSIQIKFRGINPPCCTGDIAIDDITVVPVPQLNAGINEILNPAIGGALCAGSYPLSVVFGNRGIDTITSFSVVSDVNGTIDTANFTRTIPSGDTAHLYLGLKSFVSGSNDISAYSLSPNNGIDGFNGDDTTSIAVLTANDPTNFSTINETPNSVDILAENFTDSLEIEYGAVGFVPGSGTFATTNSVPFTIAGLTAGTSYHIYIRSKCGNGDISSWVGPFTFNTSFSIPFIQDFEGFNQGITGNPWPEGWSSTTTVDPNWESENAGTPSNPTGPIVDHTLGTSLGVYVYMETSGGATGDSADFVSPPIYIDTNFNVVELKYWYFNFGINVDRMDVIVDTNGVEQVIASYVGQQQFSQADSWLEASHFLIGYQGKSVVLKFRGINPPCCTGDLAIDDITIDPVPQLSAKMDAIIEPSGSLCGGNVNPIVSVGNSGIDTLTFVDVVTDVNGLLDTTRFTGSLATGDTAYVSLPAISITNGVVYDIRFYTLSPNGGIDGFNGDDTLSIIGLTTGLSGIITLDASLPASATNYISFTALANQLNSVGVCGDVTIDVAAGTYNDVFLLSNVLGLSDSARLTVDGGDSAFVTLENNLATERALIAFDATSYVTIKNITLISTYTGTQDHFGVHFTAASSYDSIINCRILMNPTNTFGAFGVGASASITNDFAEGDNANYVTIMNCAIDGGSYSIHFEGPNAGNWNVGNSFINNTLTNMDDYGFYTDQQDSILIEGNTILGMRSTFGDGIVCFDAMNFEINANEILVEDYGIYVTNANSGDFADREATLINNMVSSFNDYGIYLTNPSRINCWHNSVYSGGNVAAVRFQNAIDSIDMRNNAFSSELNDAFEQSGTIDSVLFLKFDNNVFYAPGSTTILDISGTGYATLAAYQAARPSFNPNSLEGSPEFISDSNLRIIGGFIDEAGDNGVNILIDIDGDVRPSPLASFVDIGADEFDPPICVAPTNISIFNVAADSAMVSWSANVIGSLIEYNVTLRNSSQASGSYDTTSRDTAVLNGLLASTAYDFYIRAICRRGDTSIWVGPLAFETPCITFSAPYQEDFENAGTIPNCMKQGTNNAENWIFSRTGGHVGNVGTITGTTRSNNFFAYVDDSAPANQNTTLETPFVDVSGLSNPTLEFYRLSDNEGNFNGNVDFTVDVWDGSAWNQVYFADTNSLNQAWEFISIPLNTLTITSAIQARFIVDENNGGIFDDDVAIDDIYIGDRLPIDVGVTAIIAPLSLSGNNSCNLGVANADLIVEVENFGTTFVNSLDVSFVFNGGTPITQTFTGLGLSLSNTAQVTFDSTINLNVSGTYSIEVYTSLIGDGNLSNDTLSSSILNEGFGGVIVGNDSICFGDTTSLAVENAVGTLQWQELISGVWTDISGAVSLSIQVSPSINSDYRVLACGINPSDSFRLEAVNLLAPIVSGDTVVVGCGGSGTATAAASSINTNPKFVWYNSMSATTPINTISGVYSINSTSDSLSYFRDTTILGAPTTDTVWVSEVANAGSGNNTLKITEIDPGTPDGIEIQNVSGQTIDVTGWTVAVSNSYTNVNLANATVQTLSGNMSPNQVEYWTDGAVNAWGSNLFWNPGSNSWAIIIDDLGNIVDYIAWQWDNATLLTQSLTINGFTITPALSGAWDGNGVNGTGLAGGSSFYRFGNEDNNDLSDFSRTAIDLGTPNVGLNTPFAGGQCISPRSMAILMVDCITGIENRGVVANELSISPNPSNGLFKLNIKSSKLVSYDLEMRDMSGKLVYRNSISVNGVYQDDLDFTKLSKGVYFFQIRTSETVEVKKLIIQ